MYITFAFDQNRAPELDNDARVMVKLLIRLVQPIFPPVESDLFSWILEFGPNRSHAHSLPACSIGILWPTKRDVRISKELAGNRE